jgi:hypothetical protein
MENIGIWGVLGIIATGFVSVWGFMKYFIIQRYRLDDSTSKTLVNVIRNKSSWKFEMEKDFSNTRKNPQIYTCYAKIEGLYLFIDKRERLLTAGWQGKDNISEIHFFRWQKRKLEEFIHKHCVLEARIQVLALQPYGYDKLGELDCINPEIALDEHLYKDIEDDIKDMIDNERSKTGCLLYGKPGTGKTRLVKYFAQKFSLPICTVYLNPDYTNLDVSLMFGEIPKKCIVLLEDFDNYFNKRECIMKNENVKFTFDSIINSLDGVYNDYKQVVFIMTANDIDKIDDSIKNRSSRFKFVREITLPSYQKRLDILGDEALAKLTDGLSLDKIFFVKSLKDNYTHEEIMVKVNII